MALPFQIADSLRACLEAALEGDTAPAEVCVRAGQEVPLNVGSAQDECCSGLGWVRVVSINPVTADAINDPDDNACAAVEQLVQFELGVARCMPFGDRSAGPSCDQWNAVALLIDDDARAMRRAVCCYADTTDPDFGPVSRVRGGVWEPLEFSGGCAGGTMQVTVLMSCGDC